MAFHLEGPWLSTTGKKKGKAKYRSSAHAQQARQLEEQWKQKQQEWKKMSPLCGKTAKPKAEQPKPLAIDSSRDPRTYGKSLNHWVTGAVSSKPTQKYTGDNNVAIVVQHKSCLQPVFNQEAMVDSAKMRR